MQAPIHHSYSTYYHSFITHYTTLQYSADSLRQWRNSLRKFLLYLEYECDATPLIAVNSNDILRYKEKVHQQLHHRTGVSLSQSTQYVYLQVVKLFFNYLQKHHYIHLHPMAGIPLQTAKYGIRTGISKEEVNNLYTQCNTIAERCMLHVMYGCGLRVSEASALNVADISLTAGVLAVQAGKGNVHRLVPLNTLIQNDFNQYITHYRKAQITEKAFLLNANNQRLSAMCARLLLKRIASRCNIAVSPHQLRHSIATHLLANGLNVLYVKAFLGHKSLSSTQIYTHVSNAQLADIGTFHHHQLIKNS